MRQYIFHFPQNTFPLRLKFQDLIIYEDADIIIVNKPPNIPTLNERFDTESINMLSMAKDYAEDAQVCHRIDKETSGALIIAKHPEAYRHVSMQFESRKVTKIYHAVVDGTHRIENIEINLPILNLGKANVKIDKTNGKKALTHFNSIQYFKHYTLVECKPHTGRMHQIRIHLASLKASIAADELYGGKPVLLSNFKRKYRAATDADEQPLIKRFALHAYQVSFIPYNKTEMETYTAPYPKDMATLLKVLEKYDV